MIRLSTVSFNRVNGELTHVSCSGSCDEDLQDTFKIDGFVFEVQQFEIGHHLSYFWAKSEKQPSEAFLDSVERNALRIEPEVFEHMNFKSERLVYRCDWELERVEGAYETIKEVSSLG